MEFTHRKNEPQSFAKFPAKLRKVMQSFKIYLCGTLRFTLRNSAVKKNQDSTA